MNTLEIIRLVVNSERSDSSKLTAIRAVLDNEVVQQHLEDVEKIVESLKEIANKIRYINDVIQRTNVRLDQICQHSK